ncbi:unnamed protein product [Ostreobium quekettii]|uniref:N-acylglucosamine 2-epimerase n=1 Tax=Ostreobium quekettii TaxID=121088 RepID=A0A8S1J1P4_9CHLO|nr:unnamed protein product [Ostreobium quekettii]
MAPSVDDLESVMWAELDAWYPRCVDVTHGGFTAGYDDKWNATDEQDKAIVFQARMTWVAAEVARRRPEVADMFEPYALHGLRHLEEAMWDARHGGFFWKLENDGAHAPDGGHYKHVYGNAFAIYAAANVHRAVGDPESLALAQRAFRWLEDHAADAENGGYVEALDRRGRPLQPRLDENGMWALDHIGTAFGFKSMNTHIHMLEAYTALYRVWDDPELRDRLQALLDIIADRVYVEPGALGLYFTPGWAALPDHDSFGHDVETTYLMLEAAEVLGHEAVEAVRERAAKLTEHALMYGYDAELGGLYDSGSAFRNATDRTKVWWAQAEALNAFHLMSTIAEGEEGRYEEAFARTWEFAEEFLIDGEHAGWWWSVDEVGVPNGEPGKGNNWKSAYHTVRAMLEIADRMRSAGPGPIAKTVNEAGAG